MDIIWILEIILRLSGFGYQLPVLTLNTDQLSFMPVSFICRSPKFFWPVPPTSTDADQAVESSDWKLSSDNFSSPAQKRSKAEKRRLQGRQSHPPGERRRIRKYKDEDTDVKRNAVSKAPLQNPPKSWQQAKLVKQTSVSIRAVLSWWAIQIFLLGTPLFTIIAY